MDGRTDHDWRSLLGRFSRQLPFFSYVLAYGIFTTNNDVSFE